ncbi:MAG: DUF4091 domain-containing protein [Kiritimatiellae bacterium]|nr:DUF4091 domain-containing protein [Kiritimatiellia bacterium]
MRKLCLSVAAAAAVSASVLEARTFEVAAWRGETVAARVPDFAELGDAPAGLSVRYGVLKAVKYAPKPLSLQRLEVYDRVAWNAAEGDGPRVMEVSVPADAKPGVYPCGSARIRVVDRVLPPPKEWKYYLDLWQHPWAVARVAGVKPFSPAHYQAMRPVYELLATAGQKTITVSLLEQPWDHQCCDAYHSLVDEADFRTFDEYVQFCLDCGLGPDISCYSLCPWTLGRKIDEAELEKRWGGFLDRFTAHLKAKGWFKNTLMSMDERAPEDVRKVADFVRRHAPGMRIAMAGNRRPSEFKGIDIDVYSQSISDVSDDFLKELGKRRERGFVTTHYVCCGPSHPNTFMDSGTGEAFWLGAYPAMVGLDGFLRWAWNSWPRNPQKDATYAWWPSGDTFLCYPGGEPSWRFLELRNGIAAAEKVRLMKEAGLLGDEFAKVAAMYRKDEAIANKSNFIDIREFTLRLVNR